MDGYLTTENNLNLQRLEYIFQLLAVVEPIFLQESSEADENAKRRLRQRENPFHADFRQLVSKKSSAEIDLFETPVKSLASNPDVAFKEVIKESLKFDDIEKVETYNDEVQLGKAGYKERFYRTKFRSAGADFVELLKFKYVEGLAWVYNYYYSTCCDWEWFYPFHYAPFASDLTTIQRFTFVFIQGEPVNPIEQLLSVLPPYSQKFLPEQLRILMSSNESPIIDLFPVNFRLDINGHPYSWMGVNLLPFPDTKRIIKLVRAYENTFTDEERFRNRRGFMQLLRKMTKHNTNFNSFVQGFLSNPREEIMVEVPTVTSQPFRLKLKKLFGSSVSEEDFEPVKCSKHTSKLHEGATAVPKVVFEDSLRFINKRMFNGEKAIGIVKNAFRIDDDYFEMKESMFDRNYNNNTMKEIDQDEKLLLQRKRLREEKKSLEDLMKDYKEKK